MNIRHPTNSDHDGIVGLLRQVDWHPRVTERKQFEQMMESSQLTVVAEQAGQILGFGYALSDSVANGFITILVVHQGWRRKGIGLSMAKYLMTGNPETVWLLRSDQSLRPFWEKLGFGSSTHTMEKARLIT